MTVRTDGPLAGPSSGTDGPLAGPSSGTDGPLAGPSSGTDGPLAGPSSGTDGPLAGLTAAPACFGGWPDDATAVLAELAADNTREGWIRLRERYAVAVRLPLRALADTLALEIGPARVLRAAVDRRFRPGVPPYRTDAGVVAVAAGGAPCAVLLSGAGLAVEIGPLVLGPGQLRRYREAVGGTGGAVLAALLAELAAQGFAAVAFRPLRRAPRGVPADHPHVELLRHRGVQVRREWPAGPWLGTAEPLERVRAAWRVAAPLVAWLDAHVGPAGGSELA